MNRFYQRLSNNRGMTLVELLVAAAISLILLGGVYQIYISSLTTYRVDNELAMLQENGRFAFIFMTPNIRNAGYVGCIAPELQNLLNPATEDDFPYNFATAIEGFEANSTAQWTDSSAVTYSKTSLNTNFNFDEAVGGSDILVVRGPDQNFTSVTSTADDSSDTLIVPIDTPGIAVDDILMTVNCPDAALFTVTAWNSGTIKHIVATTIPGNDEVLSGATFPAGSEILKQITTVYYVRDKDASAGVNPGFYRKVLDGSAAEELIEGVENMQVVYGVDSDDDDSVDSYETADNVTDWDEVVAVRIGLLVRSVNEIGKLPEDTRSYTVNGTTINPLGNGTPVTPVDDKRLRQIFITTIGLRNRVL